MISIHALREEGDPDPLLRRQERSISIHALREEGDRRVSLHSLLLRDFYPRPPRGGRLVGCLVSAFLRRISIHALREEGDQADRPEITTHCAISIHALREEGDVADVVAGGDEDDFYPRPPRGGRLSAYFAAERASKFLSTPSARRATPHRAPGRKHLIISIHALREEGDFRHTLQRSEHQNFYPRPPRGGRLRTGHRDEST